MCMFISFFYLQRFETNKKKRTQKPLTIEICSFRSSLFFSNSSSNQTCPFTQITKLNTQKTGYLGGFCSCLSLYIRHKGPLLIHPAA